MGSCGSAKKNTSHSQAVKYTNKTNIDQRKVSASVTNIPNGGSHVDSEGYGRRKSVKLKELDRISKETILDDIKNFFYMDTSNQLANGSFGIIRKAIEIGTNIEYAVKMIPKSAPPEIPYDMLKFLIKNEIEICLELKHDNVIRCYKVFEDAIAVYFIFELIDGGDLFNFIQTFPNKRIPEYRVIEIFIQILDALHYIHSEKDIVHKDIKPENFLIYTEGSKLNVKLIDFGFAEKLINPSQKLKMEAGSLPYISPEMLKHSGYDTKSDMFSVGVVLFNMLTGRQPFFGRNDDERRDSILNHEPIIPKEITNPHLIHMLKGLLEKEPEKRLSVQEAKLHPWILEYINLHQQQTVKKEFVPNLSNSKNLNNLVKITNIKNIVWTNLLSYLNIEVAFKIRNYLFESYSEDKESLNNQSIQGKFSINYDLFLEAVIMIAHDNLNLVTKLKEILNNNREMCKDHIINFVDLIDFFTKSRVLMIKEKIWNYYKHIEETEPMKIVTLNNIIEYLSNDLNPNQQLKLINIAREKAIGLDTTLTFENFVMIWQEYENKVVLENRINS